MTHGRAVKTLINLKNGSAWKVHEQTTSHQTHPAGKQSGKV